MSLNFDIHAQSELKCSDVENGTVSYGLPSVLKLEPGRCVTAVKTGVFIHDCHPSGLVWVTPTDAFADSLVFSDNSFGPSTAGITFSITNISKGFVRVEPTQLLCKYQFVANPTRAVESSRSNQPTRARSRSQLIVPVKVLQAVAAVITTAPTPAPVAPVASVESVTLSRAARRRARRQSVDLAEEDAPATPEVAPATQVAPATPEVAPATQVAPATLAVEDEEQVELVDLLHDGDEEGAKEGAEEVEADESDETDDVSSSRGRRSQKNKRITV